MRSRGFVLVVLALLFAPTTALAEDEDEDEATGRREVPASRFEMWFGGTMFAPSLRDARFSGAGTSLGGRVSVDQTGSELGLRMPTFYGAELGVAYRRTYFAAGLTGFMATARGADATPTNPYVAGLASPGNPIAFGGAVEILGAIPIGPFTASLGGVAGLRAFQVPLNGFEPSVCRERGRAYACSTDATTRALPFVQPRLRVDVTLDKARTFFVGGYVGMEVLGDRSLVAGLMLGFRTANLSF